MPRERFEPMIVALAPAPSPPHDELVHQLREHNVAVVSLWPGLVLTERIMAFAAAGPSGATELFGLDLAIGESPRFPGRAVVALASDPDVMRHTGRSLATWALAREYGFTDVDGTRPDWGTHFKQDVVPNLATIMAELSRS